MPVPYGNYDSAVTYICNGTIAPYVLYAGQYYVMNKETSWLGNSIGRTPAQDYATYGNNATWLLMDKYKALFAELLLADFGKIASAVFYGGLMFSQQGKVNGVASSNYSSISVKANGDIDESAGKFVPNFWVNFLNGKMHAVDGVFDGDLYTKLTPIDESGANFVPGSGYWFNENTALKLTLHNVNTSYPGNRREIILPTANTFIGKRIVLVDTFFPPYTRTIVGIPEAWTVRGQSRPIQAAAVGTNFQQEISAANYIDFYGGYVELLGIPRGGTSYCDWMLVSYRCTYFNTRQS